MNNIFRYFANRLIKTYIYLFKGILMGPHVKFNGFPLILKHPKASIYIGKNTLINSSNHGYHINMHSKSKIYADKPFANISIGDNCRIHGTCIHAYKEISIGKNCLIAANSQIIDGNGHLLSFDRPENRVNTTDSGKPIIISDNVWIGANCFVLGGATIGRGTIIAANSLVIGNIPSNCIFGGNPAKLIKQF